MPETAPDPQALRARLGPFWDGFYEGRDEVLRPCEAHARAAQETPDELQAVRDGLALDTAWPHCCRE